MFKVADPESRPDFPLTLARQLFGLTPAEARLVASLVAGQSLQETAAANRLSRNTVRVQLQAVFGKTNTNRQVDLIHLLARLPQRLHRGAR